MEASFKQQLTADEALPSAVGRAARAFWLGRVDYDEAQALQKWCVAERQAGRIPDTLLLLEHPPTYTIGRSGGEQHLLVSEAEIVAAGGSVHRVDRGGDITYHGPGQLVGYPILDLNDHYRDAHRYLRELEEVLIRLVAEHGLTGGRIEGLSGVWLKDEKVAALGVHLSRWVTSHGFALNVTTDLKDFDRIVPCGIRDHGVTSLERVLGRALPLEAVAERAAFHLAELFALDLADGLVATTPPRLMTEDATRG